MAATPDAAVEAAGGIPGEFLPYHPDRLDVYLARQTRLGSPAYLAVILLLASSAAALPVVAVPVSVTGRGTLAKAGAFTPDRVAEALWSAVSTADADWRSEVPYSG